MSLTQIEYFVAVAESGGINRASLQLAVSQPPLTRQIRLLEDELGTPLFTRTSRGMTLLPAGERFMMHARTILNELRSAREAVRNVGLAPINNERCEPVGQQLDAHENELCRAREDHPSGPLTASI